MFLIINYSENLSFQKYGESTVLRWKRANGTTLLANILGDLSKKFVDFYIFQTKSPRECQSPESVLHFVVNKTEDRKLTFFDTK